MFEEAPIDSQRHCRQQLCCWFSWGQNLQTFPKENSIQNKLSQNTTVTQKASPKTLPKLRRPPVWPKLLYLRPNCARSGLPRSEFLEATRTFNSKILCSVCQIVSVYFMHFHAFSCILMHFALQSSWFSHAVLHSPWIAQILHKGSRFL